MKKHAHALIGEGLGHPSWALSGVPDEGECPFMKSFFDRWPPGPKRGVGCTKGKTGCVCSLHRSPYAATRSKLAPKTLISVCPKRFLDEVVIDDILGECWPDKRSGNIRVACETRLGDAGNVDLVVVELDSTGDAVNDFLSIELQAVDITGSYQNILADLRAGGSGLSNAKYGFNTKNVYKRFVPQLIQKGFIHQAWGKRIVAVVQDFIFEDMSRRSGGELPTTAESAANLVFFPYSFVKRENKYGLKLGRPVYSSHNLLANLLYQTIVPPREKFENLLLRKIAKSPR